MIPPFLNENYFIFFHLLLSSILSGNFKINPFAYAKTPMLKIQNSGFFIFFYNFYFFITILTIIIIHLNHLPDIDFSKSLTSILKYHQSKFLTI